MVEEYTPKYNTDNARLFLGEVQIGRKDKTESSESYMTRLYNISPKGIDQTIDRALDRLAKRDGTGRFNNLVKLSWGLEDGKVRSDAEIAKEMNMLETGIVNMRKTILKYFWSLIKESPD